jgi:hypothetical protein
MQQKFKLTVLIAMALVIATPTALAQSPAPSQPAPAEKPQMIAVATVRPLTELLPDKLAGVKATSDIKQYTGDGLAELVAERAPIYREYLVTRAASRQYGAARVEVFETQNPLGAYGLLSFATAASNAVTEVIGANSARLDGAIVFWRENYFVRVTDASGQSTRAASYTPLARALAESIKPTGPPLLPSLIGNLPETSLVAGSARYALGPESLNTFVASGREIFAFSGDAEAVVAEYKQSTDAAIQGHADAATSSSAPSSSASPRPHVPASSGSPAPVPPMKLVIVEYNTPQFAFDATARASEYVNSLPESEQNHIIVKREGNYLIEAVDFQNREMAQSLVDAVKYPYGVKWLHHPKLPARDPFRMQKAAQMLISSFGLLGILILSVLGGGAIFGTTIFLKRRKQMREAFSDAGDMLRLNIDPFEASLLGLPPKRE